MADLTFAECPSCGKRAKGKLKVEELFGCRNNSGYIMVQSHCRQCRSRESTLRKRAGITKHHPIK